MRYTVGEVAAASGVTVRALHHYDEIGLVVPERTESGYRTYDYEALRTLQQVLLLRELGFPLETIGQILRDPVFDRRDALIRQKTLAVAQLRRTQTLIASIRAIDAHDGGREMGPEELFEGLSEYEVEAKGYSKDDVAAAQAEADVIAERFGELMRTGATADSDKGLALAEEHRMHIDQWWYPCTKAMHANLGEMYVQDHRFTEYWDKYEPGLASFVRDAIAANAGRRPGSYYEACGPEGARMR